MFATALAMSVAGMGEDGFVPASVRELGGRHLEYGVSDAFYATFGKALLSTLEASLGPDFTPEVREAWAASFESLAAAMKRAAAEAREAKEREGSAT
jgi:hemoglobin-like flavoprotein